jgi:phosphonate degradation associated HDIG domain protein
MNTAQKSKVINHILNAFRQRGDEKYADEGVSQAQHALQTAMLARSHQAPDSLVVAALLHDLGHILSDQDLPESCHENLDDKHEELGFAFLTQHFDAEITDPIRMHVAAKRYLCTIEPDYRQRLSPTSLKSYFDQGGEMNVAEKLAFESEPHFSAAVRLRRWDDLAKDPNATTPDIEFFVPMLEQLVRPTTKAANTF